MKVNKNWRHKSGIYKITNLVNNKYYIGSSVDLYTRCYTYLCLAQQHKIHNIHLQNAINKYGISSFRFEVLEFVNFSNLVSSTNIKLPILQAKEQSYIILLKPAYNHRTIVDKNTAIKHSNKTKEKISTSLKEAFLSGRKKINRIYSHNIPVSLFSLEGKLVGRFEGLSFCAEYLGVHSESISYAITSKRRVCKGYIVLKTKEEEQIETYIGIPRVTYSKPVSVLDISLGITQNYLTTKQAAKEVACKVDTLTKYIKNGKPVKGRYKVSYT